MRRCAPLVAARRWTLLLVAALGVAAERCDEASYRNGINSCSPCDPNGNCTGLDFSPRSNATQQLDLGVFLPLAKADGAPLWGTTRLWPLAATAAVAADMFARGDGRVAPAFANRCDGVAVSLTYHNTEATTFGTVTRYREWSAASFAYLDGVLGAAASARSIALATSTAIDETPMVSYMSTSPELNSRSHYPYFLRTILDDAGTASDDVYASGNVEAFLKACVAREISATASGYAAHDARALDVALGTVQSARHAVVVAVPAATELVEVVRGALRRNMTGPDYAWAWVSSRMTTVATDETFDDETRAALAGAAHVTGEFVPLDTPNMDALEEAYKNSTADPNSRMAPQAAAGLGAPSADGYGWGRSFHGYAFDAFAAFALAACAVVDGGGDVADGAALRAALLASDFEGASGRVRFDETTGTRRSDDAIFEVANVWDGAYAVVGRWTAGNWSYAAPFRFADGGTAPPPDTIREPCAPGAARVDVDGVDVCVPCEAGTFAAGGDDACAACAAGRFAADGFGASAASGATSCERCPANTFAGPGAFVCSPCLPGEGFASDGGSANCSICLDGFYADGGSCVPCLDDAACPRGTTLATVDVVRGFWRGRPRRRSSPAAPPPTVAAAPPPATRRAARRPGRLCEACDPGKWRDDVSGSCRNCSRDRGAKVAAGLLWGIAVAACFWSLVWASKIHTPAALQRASIRESLRDSGGGAPQSAEDGGGRPSHRGFRWSSLSLLASLTTMRTPEETLGVKVSRLLQKLRVKWRTLFIALQIIAAAMPRFGVDYPSAFSSVLRALRVFELNLGFTPLSCAVDGYSYYDELVFATCAPVAVVAAYKVVVSARALVPGRRDRDEEDSTLAAAVLVAFLVFPSSSSTAMAFWRCRGGFGDGKRYLAADLSVECGGPKYAAYEVFAGLMVCVWPVGVPLCFYALLFRVRDKINPLRKLGFSQSLVAPGTAANVLYCVVLVLLSAKLYQARQPFAATSDNHLAEALSWLLAAIFLTALLQKTTADGDVAADVALVGLVLLSLTIGA
ncbi:G-protein coupled receptor [Aureococcus anophagefferens]|nr:G-protein coupled receptor [Aureococcus anophagefferens]